jgi:hypothetical protein
MGVRFRPRFLPTQLPRQATWWCRGFFFYSGANFPAPMGIILGRQIAVGPTWMRAEQHTAEEFRRYAAMCVAMAERMAVRENRDRMMEMAERFLKLAQKEDAKAE